MKKLILLLNLIIVSQADIIKIDPKQMEKWDIQTAIPIKSDIVPLGEFVSEITIPPQLLYTITLPFTAQILKVNIANYQYVTKGQTVANVTGQEWIEMQKKFIEESIELKHHKHIAIRKNNLCKEDIIPKKECHSADAEYQADIIKVEASKALLKSYGATPTMIKQLFKNLKISNSIPIRVYKSGTVIELNMRVGKTLSPSEPMLIIKKEGNLWLEAELPISKAKLLKDKEVVTLRFKDKTFSSQVLQHSPIINNQNQTQKVKFLLPSKLNLLAGLRDSLFIQIRHKSLKVDKKSIIHKGEDNILFVRNKLGFEAIAIKIIAEDKDFYYIENRPNLSKPIATTSIAILKSLMEQDNE